MSESAALLGVQEWLIGNELFTENQCQVEIDEFAPTVASDLYVSVMPGGWSAGPNNTIGGGVLDELFGVNVDVILRAPKMPRDRTRNLLLNPQGGQDALGGLNVYLRQIIALIHFSYDCMTTCNNYISDTNAAQGFIHPLVFLGVDGPPRVVGPEVFSQVSNDKRAALARTARFGNLRRIQYQSAQS